MCSTLRQKIQIRSRLKPPKKSRSSSHQIVVPAANCGSVAVRQKLIDVRFHQASEFCKEATFGQELMHKDSSYRIGLLVRSKFQQIIRHGSPHSHGLVDLAGVGVDYVLEQRFDGQGHIGVGDGGVVVRHGSGPRRNSARLVQLINGCRECAKLGMNPFLGRSFPRAKRPAAALQASALSVEPPNRVAFGLRTRHSPSSNFTSPIKKQSCPTRFRRNLARSADLRRSAKSAENRFMSLCDLTAKTGNQPTWQSMNQAKPTRRLGRI